jgi:hypothetical protein
MKLDYDNLKISRETLQFIKCLESESNLFSQVYGAIHEVYGKSVDDIMEKRFCDKFNALRDEIDSFLVASIHEKTGITGSNEI